ncbi:hypothetical protein DEA98_24940 [Brucella pseudogrignonensis]|nr:hypothetical protein [Brucella pseudogrignonensis]
MGEDALLWNETAGAFDARHGTSQANRISNIADGVLPHDAVNLGQLQTVAAVASTAQSAADHAGLLPITRRRQPMTPKPLPILPRIAQTEHSQRRTGPARNWQAWVLTKPFWVGSKMPERRLQAPWVGGNHQHGWPHHSA